ncbi:MAG: hypothetical protein V1792_11250 [Pseudomonadota bacterium]
MTSEVNSRRLELHFEGRKPEDIHVPVETLAQVLNGMQKTIHLLAMHHEKVEVRYRAVPPGHIKQRYEVLCSPMEPGSVVVPVIVGNAFSDLFSPRHITSVVDLFQRAGEILSAKKLSDLGDLIPDGLMRTRVVESFRSMVPKSGSGWKLNVADRDRRGFSFSEALQAPLKCYLKRSTEDEAVQTVTGQLIKIDFSEHKVTILYPVTNRALDCFYDESMEELLLENRREMIQVTGKVILDDNDLPAKIIDVESISELDLSPFLLSEFQYDDRVIRFDPPRYLEPHLDETRQLLCLERAELGIHVFAPTREELFEELHTEMEMLWFEYARERDHVLTDEAKELKANLLQNLREEKIAAGQAEG